MIALTIIILLLMNNNLSSGVSVEQVLYYLCRKYIKIDVAEGPQICLESDNVHDWVDAAFGFYKGKRFQKDAPFRLVLKGKSIVDAGGVGRQFFTTCSI